MEKTDSILDFSPFGTASKKRPASEISSSSTTTAAKVSPTLEDDQNKKRAATNENISKSSSSTSLFSDSVATMTKDESRAILKKTCLPKTPKKQSQYVRFKNLMLKQAKAAKDKETQDNITTIAKEAWNMVKDKSVADVSIEDASSETKLDKYMRLKAHVVADEQKEASDYSTQLEKFKSNYLDAAVSFLYWETHDASTSTLDQFEKEVKSIHSNIITAWNGDLPSNFTEIYKTAQAKLDTLQKDSAISKIVSQLRNASEDVLYQHALEHYNLQQQLVELNTLKAKAAALETEKANEEAKQMASAYSIKGDICRDLKKLMVYTGPQLKYTSKKISCRRKGVTPKMFAVAFGVAEGVKSFTFDGDEVGLKSLRYGYLSCGKVTVKLIGDAVSASTSYSL